MADPTSLLPVFVGNQIYPPTTTSGLPGGDLIVTLDESQLVVTLAPNVMTVMLPADVCACLVTQ